MRDFRDAKLMAKTLRAALAAEGANLSHAQSLELTAKAFGLDSWNVLAARIKAQEAAAPAARPGGALPDRVAQIELGCTDLAAARVFYCEVLGLPFVDAFGDSLFVRCGDLNLIIQQSETPRRGRPLYFEADGRVGEMTAALKGNGVVFTQEPRRIARNFKGVDVWLGFFDDPWGNPFGLLANMPPADD
jgi:catechol 2,3-dioxygenase-like lactoylglutathione lyase family enzyme